MEKFEFLEKQTVLKQGSKGSYFYIVEECVISSRYFCLFFSARGYLEAYVELEFEDETR